MTWFVTTLLLILTFGHLLEAKHLKKKLSSSVVIIGKVYCDTCFQHNFDKSSHFISGATVAVGCKRGAETFRSVSKTDRRGVFKVHLPFSLSKHVKTIQGCSIKLVKSSEPYCAVASTATASSSSIRLKSRRHGTHVFSAGFFTFKPQNEPTLCNQKPISLNNNNNNNPELSFPPPLKDPANPGDLPPLPSLPIPNIPLPDLSNLPNLPNVPRVLPILPPIPPIIAETQKTAAQVLHPQTFNIFPPNTFPQPQPQIPGLLPPLTPLLPRLPSINLPPIITVAQKKTTINRDHDQDGKASVHPQTFNSFPPNAFLLPPLPPLLPRLPSINLPPIITTTQKTAAIKRDNDLDSDQTDTVHPQTFPNFPPNTFLQPQPSTLPSLLPPLPPLLPRLPSINLPPIITATKKTATIKRDLSLDHDHNHGDHQRVDTKETFNLPPNPFQPTPPTLIPNPFQPTPPPLFPSPLFPLPTIPSLIPSPPPPPPALPFPFPPFPLHPPRGPGTPPTT